MKPLLKKPAEPIAKKAGIPISGLISPNKPATLPQHTPESDKIKGKTDRDRTKNAVIPTGIFEGLKNKRAFYSPPRIKTVFRVIAPVCNTFGFCAENRPGFKSGWTIGRGLL